MSLARTRTRNTRSGVEHSNHEAIAPPKALRAVEQFSYMKIGLTLKFIQLDCYNKQCEFPWQTSCRKACRFKVGLEFWEKMAKTYCTDIICQTKYLKRRGEVISTIFKSYAVQWNHVSSQIEQCPQQLYQFIITVRSSSRPGSFYLPYLAKESTLSLVHLPWEIQQTH